MRNINICIIKFSLYTKTMINQLNITVDAALSAKINEAVAHYDTDEKGLVLLALKDFLHRDHAFRQEFSDDKQRLQEYLETGNAVANEDIMAWVNSEITTLNKQIALSPK